MPVAVLHSRSLAGFDAPAVAVEVHLSGGLPAFNLGGLPETEVKESRDRVRAARRRRERQGKPNGRLQPREVERHCVPQAEGEALLKSAFARLALSARAYYRILKVARTIADRSSAGCDSVAHIAEAIGYRRLERA